MSRMAVETPPLSATVKPGLGGCGPAEAGSPVVGRPALGQPVCLRLSNSAIRPAPQGGSIDCSAIYRPPLRRPRRS
eukprot:scaffold207_cov409-Prasinococcus_capsulatus_cf.AAC.71